MGIEPTQDLLGPTLVLKTRGTTRHQSPPHSAALWPIIKYTVSPRGTKDFSDAAVSGDRVHSTLYRAFNGSVAEPVAFSLLFDGRSRRPFGRTR
jgi:hypothetical protein